ncbi:alpha/beta fold hydrolase [Anaeroselena agilis]|uniref:Alpha/beta hydrolase n=1 Tax=Anaeroselena agilis TaxID=3063788 RepID=A0ABU3P4P1_9FIRM|nr:alpha/beta hydrolase [Selenomonadales bacterium 4137-cl]
MGFYVKVEPGVRLYVEELNPEGREAILFLHGWPASHRMFEYQFDELFRLGYRCIGVDCRGFGKADKPAGGYDYDRQADDILAVVQALRLENATLLGHSTGGAIAVRYMARHGCGFARLALCAAAAPSLIRRPYFPHGLEREAVEKIIAGTLADRPAMLRDFGDMFFFQYKTQPLMEWFFQMGLEAAGWATAAVAQVWLDEERLFADLGEIRVPTLIMHGIHDRVCHFPLGVAQHEGIACSRLVPFKYSGHGLFYDEREKFNAELARFAAGR